MIRSKTKITRNLTLIPWRYYLYVALAGTLFFNRSIKKSVPSLQTQFKAIRPTRTGIQFKAIAEKWGLSESAIPLLVMQGERRVDYNSTTDILAFYHPLKTGGTSLSDVLKQTFPDGVISGSERSGYFNPKEFESAIEERSIDFWSNQRVLYSHTPLRLNRPEQNGRGSVLGFLRNKTAHFPEKKYRLLTLIRDPIAWRASKYYEQMCHVGRWMRETKSTNYDSSGCLQVNLTDVARMIFEQKVDSCKKKKAGKKCKSYRPSDFRHCGSIDIALASGKLDNLYEKNIMGLLPELPSKNNSLTPTYEDVELHTLRDLGGLVEFNENYGGDFIWFGITERMEESMCVFYYNLQLDPLPMPHTRFKKCRPTNFWEERHLRWVREHEKFDYAVWRAGNAVLDVRVKAMRLEIQARIDAGEQLDSIRYLAPGCFSKNDSPYSEDQ